MRYALISDIHGNAHALSAVIEDALIQKVNCAIFLGDYCVGLPSPTETLECLYNIPIPSYFVEGNEEERIVNLSKQNQSSWVDGQFSMTYWCYNNLTNCNVSFLSSLQKIICIDDAIETPIYAFHKPELFFKDTFETSLEPKQYYSSINAGLFTNNTFQSYVTRLLSKNIPLFEKSEILPKGVYAFGHSHIQWSYAIDNILLVSPGSCGLPLDLQRDAPYIILEYSKQKWNVELRRVQYDTNKVIKTITDLQLECSAKIWASLIGMEVLTAYEQAVPFLKYVEKYARSINDYNRPFSKKTWINAFNNWLKIKDKDYYSKIMSMIHNLPVHENWL